MYNSVRKAGKRTGSDVLEQFRDDGLEGTKRKRKTAAKYKVNKNNTLVFVDNGFDARIREYGATIRAPAGKGLRIVFDDKLRERIRRDTAKGRRRGYFLIDNPGGPLLMETQAKGEAKPVAIIKKRVVRKPLMRGDRLSTIVEQNVDGYIEEIRELILESY